MSGRSQKRKSASTVRIPMNPDNRGAFREEGYSLSASARTRHAALNRLVKSEGYAPVVHKLNALATLHKTSNPEHSKTFREDMEYVQSKYKK